MTNRKLGSIAALLSGLNKGLLVAASLLLAAASAFAAGDSGGQVAQFMSFGAGARSLSMGRAFFAVADDASSVYANPAGMTQLERKEVSFLQATIGLDTSLSALNYVNPSKKGWVWGINMTQMKTGGFEKIEVKRNSVGEISELKKGGDFSDDQSAYIFGFGKKVLSSLAVGMSLKQISRSLDGNADSFITADAAALTQPSANNPNYKLAFGIQNIFAIKSGDTDDNLPLLIKIGNSYRGLKDKMVLAFDVSQNFTRNISEWNLGAEYWVWKYIVLRAGVEGNPGLRQSGFGLGLKVKGINLDIAQGLTDLGVSSRMGMSLKFGKSVIAKREDTARRLIQEGIAAYQQGNFLLALDRLNRSLDLDPTNNDVRVLTARLSSIVTTMPSAVGDGEVPNIIRRAVQDYLKGDNKSAINSLRYAYLEKDPTNEKLLQVLNKIEKEAREKLTERADQRKKGFSYIDQKLYDALQAIYDAKYDKAIILLQEVLDLDPQNIEAMKRLGSAFFLIEQKAQAKEVWTRAMELDPSDTVIQQYLEQNPVIDVNAARETVRLDGPAAPRKKQRMRQTKSEVRRIWRSRGVSRRILFFLGSLLLTAQPIFLLSESAPAPAAPAPAAPSETDLLEKQRVMEKDLEQRVMNIMEKVMGPNQSEVKATINLSIVKDVKKKSGSGQQSKRKEENPLGDTKFILPGVPAPKNVAKEKEPENVSKQRSDQEREQTQISFRIITSKREVVAFYNEKLKSKEPEARRAIEAMTDLKGPELKFIPGKFFSSVSTFWDDFTKDPKNLLWAVLLFLLFLLLIWLFIPLTSFFRNFVKAMKEKGGIEVKMESTSEDEGDLNKDGMTPEEMAAAGLNPQGEEGGEEELQKKYAPFEYITEENLKRLLGVFRKEPPQVIALILSYLKQDLVKTIYAELPPDLQVKVAAEASAVRQATEEQVRMVDENIKAKIDFVVGGVDNLIKILEEVDYKIRDNILEYLMNHKPQLYEKVRASILLFEDFAKFPDPAVQTILRELKTDQLGRCLKSASPELLNKFITNMSQGGAALLKEEMEFGRPVSEEQIEVERAAVMNKVKEMEAEGKIQIREKKKISVFESEDATSPLTPSLLEGERGGRREPARSAGASPAFGAPAQESAHAADAASYVAYGEQLYTEGKHEEAISYLNYAIEQDPQNAPAYQALGHCYYQLGQTSEALQCYEYALTLAPQDEALRQWVEQFKQSAEIG